MDRGRFLTDMVPGLAAAGITAVGLHELNYLSPEFQLIRQHLVPFGIGFATGLGQNFYLRNRTFNILGQPNPDGSPKTVPGIIKPSFVSADQKYALYDIDCIDARIHRKTPRVPGGYGPLGAEPIGLSTAIAALHYNHSSPEAITFAAGYLSASNILTTGELGLNLIQTIFTIANDPNTGNAQKVDINLHNHFLACGAEGMTDPLTQILKFDKHITPLVDLLSIPKEVAAWLVLSTTLRPTVSLLTLGRVSVRPQLFAHSPMTNSH